MSEIRQTWKRKETATWQIADRGGGLWAVEFSGERRRVIVFRVIIGSRVISSKGRKLRASQRGRKNTG